MRIHLLASRPSLILALFLPLLLIAAPRPAAAADHVLLIGGLGGTTESTKLFTDGLLRIRASLTQHHGYAPERVRLLAEHKGAPGVDDVVGSATIHREFARLASTMNTSDTLLLIMVGHGQSDFTEPKFNLPGPDLSGPALAAMLDALPARDQRLLLIFECSGDFAQLLSRTGRCIISSGDGPRQIYQSIIPSFLPAAFEGREADLNADGRLSMEELFQFLARRVDDDYARRGLIQTENTALDDNGDADLTTRASGKNASDGARAKRIFLTPPSR